MCCSDLFIRESDGKLKKYVYLLILTKCSTLGLIIWGIITISSDINNFHSEGEFYSNPGISYLECDNNVCNECAEHSYNDEYGRHVYWLCDKCLPINSPQAGQNGFNMSSKSCSPSADRDKIYLLHYECHSMDPYTPPSEPPICKNATYKAYDHPIYPFRPSPPRERKGYMCKEGYNSTDTDQGTLFNNAEDIFDVFDSHSTLLYRSIDTLVVLLVIFWAFPIDSAFIIFLHAIVNEEYYSKKLFEDRKKSGICYYLILIGYTLMSIIITISTGALIPTAIYLPINNINYTKSKCLQFEYNNYNIFTNTPTAAYVLYFLSVFGFIPALLHITCWQDTWNGGKGNLLREYIPKVITLTVALVTYLSAVVYAICIIGFVHTTSSHYSTVEIIVIAYSAIHTLFSIMHLPIALYTSRQNNSSKKEVEEENLISRGHGTRTPFDEREIPESHIDDPAYYK